MQIFCSFGMFWTWNFYLRFSVRPLNLIGYDYVHLTPIAWFSFFHEIGHILLHKKREIFIENGYDTPELREQEEEANQFARDLLIPQKDFEVFVMSGSCKSEASVKTFAKSLNIKTPILITAGK